MVGLWLREMNMITGKSGRNRAHARIPYVCALRGWDCMTKKPVCGRDPVRCSSWGQHAPCRTTGRFTGPSIFVERARLSGGSLRLQPVRPIFRYKLIFRSEEAFRMEEFTIPLLSEDGLPKILNDNLIATCYKNGCRDLSLSRSPSGCRSYRTSQ
jgi:hypothetical protein